MILVRSDTRTIDSTCTGTGTLYNADLYTHVLQCTVHVMYSTGVQYCIEFHVPSCSSRVRHVHAGIGGHEISDDGLAWLGWVKNGHGLA